MSGGASIRRAGAAAAAPVSIVVPVRDYEQYLDEALGSILEQEPRPAQVIVVDDGSRDRSAEVAERTDGVELIRQRSLGVAAAVNAGVERAGQPLLAFLDADDRWPRGSLAARLAALDRDPHSDAIFGSARQFHSPDLDPQDRQRLIAPPVGVAARVRGTMLIRAAAYERVGHPDSRWAVGEFIDWWARAEELGLRSAMLDEVVLERRLHRGHIGRRSAELDLDLVRVVRAAVDRRRSGTGR